MRVIIIALRRSPSSWSSSSAVPRPQARLLGQLSIPPISRIISRWLRTLTAASLGVLELFYRRIEKVCLNPARLHEAVQMHANNHPYSTELYTCAASSCRTSCKSIMHFYVRSCYPRTVSPLSARRQILLLSD